MKNYSSETLITGGRSTVAWFTSTANYTGAKTSSHGITGSLQGTENAAQADNLYLKLTATVDNTGSDTCYLTTSDGYVYYVNAANKLRGPIEVANADKADLYGEITFTAGWFNEAGGSNAASQEQLNNLSAGSVTFTLGSQNGSRTRLAKSISFTVTDKNGNTPYSVNNFASDFGNSYGNTLTLTVAWAAKGTGITVAVGDVAAVAIASAKAYYAIGGTADIADKAAQDTIVAAGTAVSPDTHPLTGKLTLA